MERNNASGEKARSGLKQLADLCQGQWGTLFWAVFWFAVKHSPVYVLPIITANLINIVTDFQNHSLGELWLNLAVGGVFIVQNVLTAWLHTRAYSSFTRGIEQKLRTAMVYKLQKLSIQFYTQSQSGRLLSKVMRDVENVEQMLQSSFGSIVPLFTSITVTVAVTACNNPRILWLYLVAVPVAGITVGAFRRPIRKSNRKFRCEMERTQAAVSEMIEMVAVTRAYGLADQETERMDGLLSEVRNSGYRLDTVNAVFGATSWVAFQLFQLAFLGITGILAWQHRISVGEVVLYQNYFAQIVAAVSGVVNLFPVIAKGMESLNSINDIMDSTDEERSGTVPAPCPIEGAVDFEHVQYHYPEADHPALQDFTLHVPAGSSVAFVGSSGAGKSTLLSLLLGFCQPDSGTVKIDGNDLRAMDLKSFRSQIAVVPQSTILFTGTLRDNIAYAAPDATDKEIMEVVQQIGLGNMVAQLPEGLDTMVTEHGNNFSGGQRQRIAIARALIRRPKLLIFDEATSALDSESERIVSEACEKLVGKCTTFLVAHRLSTIRAADTIVVMENGQITEQGSYEELMEKKGRFYELKIMQR